MNQTSPKGLLEAAQGGDRAALGQLVQAHRHGVYRYGLQVCRTTEDAEDAVQETLWAAARAIKSFRGSASSIVSWMFTIVRRVRSLTGRHRDAVVTDGARSASRRWIAESRWKAAPRLTTVTQTQSAPNPITP